MLRSFAVFSLIFYSLSASAYFQMDMLKGKKTNKENSQWTLADWLAQKNKMALADQWLALNSSANWFDLTLSGAHNEFKLKSTDASGTVTNSKTKGQSYQLDAYFSIFNLYGEYEVNNDQKESYAGAAGLRLFGTSSQTTNLVVRYGLRSLTSSANEKWQNQFAEAQLQLYLLKQFGLQGKYRHYFPDDSNLGNRLEGHRLTAGAFIELLIFRIYGDYYQEPMERSSSGAVTKEQRDGMEYGVRLFF